MAPAYLKSKPVLPTVAVPYWCAGTEAFESGRLAAEVAKRNDHKARDVYLGRTCRSYHLGLASKTHKISSKAARAELIRGK
jgi:hypothetical protein